jgi:hypothetical protein
MAVAPVSAGRQPISDCELHVWPAKVLEVGTVGTVGGREGVTARGGLIGALFSEKNPDRMQILAATLYQERQLSLISGSEPNRLLLSDPQCRIIVHESQEFDRSLKTRQTPSLASIYYELSVDAVYFNSHPLYGKDILAYYTFRNFGEDEKYRRQVSRHKRVKTGALSFESEDASRVSLDAIEQAFVETFRKFAGESVKP